MPCSGLNMVYLSYINIICGDTVDKWEKYIESYSKLGSKTAEKALLKL